MFLAHGTRYAFGGQARLAYDIGVARSTVSRLVRGESAPSLRLAEAVTGALSADLGVDLAVSDVFSADGRYARPDGCALCLCGGCMPPDSYDRRGLLRPGYAGMRPGDWSRAPASDSAVPPAPAAAALPNNPAFPG